MLLTDALN